MHVWLVTVRADARVLHVYGRLGPKIALGQFSGFFRCTHLGVCKGFYRVIVVGLTVTR
jgi:hypothetical protein